MDQPFTVQQAVDLANHHADAGRLPEAEHLYRQILAHEPNHATALHGLGIIGQKTGHHAAAADLMRRSVEFAPHLPHYRSNLAVAFRSAGKAEESLRVLQESVQRFPRHVQSFRELGATLGALNRPAEAIVAYEQSLRLREGQPPTPNEQTEREIDSRVHINIGAILAGMNRFDEAIVANDRAIALCPASAVAHMNRGHLLFRKGRLREAFAEYDWRWKIPDFTARWPAYPQPSWDGSDPRGKTILLWHEQGMGDTIHFVRYAPLVAQRGARVIVLCQPQLKTLLEAFDPALQIVTDEQPLPPFDLHLPLAGLPRVFQTERDTIPFPTGYFHADPQKAAIWAQRLIRDGGDPTEKPALRVGLVWAGSPGHLNDRNRSLTLDALRPILAVPNVRFHSLQKGGAAGQLSTIPLPAPVADLCDELKDFSDTAGLAANLDLIITVDTAVAHLAGALGKEVWTLVTFEPDFRWLCDEDRSCWYSSLRLFRQPTPGNWAGAIMLVADELAKLSESRAIGAPRFEERFDARAEATQLHNSALSEFQKGQQQQAINLMARAVELMPADPNFHRGLATLYRMSNRLPEAIAALRKAIAQIPGSFVQHRELGLALKLAGQNQTAVAEYQTALRVHAADPTPEDPESRRLADAEVYLNLGVALSELNRHDEALAATDAALELNPQNGLAHLNRAAMRFRRGDVRGGFDDYEFRWNTAALPQFAQPRWDGSELAGKTILLWNEQGFGDTIQFCRYAPLVAARGGKVILRCQPPLERLLASLQGAEHIIADDQPLPSFDVHAPIMSLAHIMGTTLETIPAPRRYLSADPALAARWRDRLDQKNGGKQANLLRVGIVVAGSVFHQRDAERSIGVDAIKPLMAASGVQFVSLQKGGAGRELIAEYGDRLVDLAEELKDFADTAALIENLDLIIAVDTAVAHLAGALGKEVWMLLAAEPEFRWMFERKEGRWYSSMRIYRQPRAGDWAGALREVERDMRQRAARGAVTASKTPGQNDPAVESMLAAAHEHHAAGRLQQAEPLYRQVLERQPDEPSALHHLGLIAHRCGQSEQAIGMMQRSVEIDPTQAFFFKNLGSVCRAMGRSEECVKWLGRAIELSPADPMLREELGVTLEKLDRLDESVLAYQCAVDLLGNSPSSGVLADPERRRVFDARLHSNLGAALERQGKFEKAMPHFEQAIKVNPEYGLAHMHRANVLFRRRDLPAAFGEYEWRFAAKGFPTPWRKYPQPVWDGSDLAGRTILLWPEQGLGDVIQFARFAPLVAQRGNVILQCLPPLKRVLETLSPNVRIIREDEALPKFDVHLPLISLPRVLGTTFDSLPAPNHYLSADPQLARRWADRIGIDQPGLRIGLVWSGSPSFAYNHRRSIPLQGLLPLTQIAGVRPFSLQTGEAAKQLNSIGAQYSIVDLSNDIHDFADSAAILANLDLLISTDTSIVHLAGAMGRQTRVLLWSERDFRWLMDDRSMPWYPSVQPFLQTTSGNWTDVIESVAREIHHQLGR